MRARRRVWPVILPVGILLTITCAAAAEPRADSYSAGPSAKAGQAAPPATNEYCPVQPTERAIEEYELEYAGKKIHFCCEPCMRAFKKNPQAYLKNLPQFDVDPAELEDEQDPVMSLLAEVNEQTRQHVLLFSSITLGLLVTTWIARALFRRAGWRSSVRPGIVCLGACILIGSAAALYWRVQSLNDEIHEHQLKDLLHFATYHDFGDRPIPAKPPVERRLKATFYRGNDERSPRLFNGGHYRTCTFHIALCDEVGREVPFGANVAERQLGVRLQIERAPHTPDFFWTPERMQRYFLTQRYDPFMGSEGPIADRVDLRTEQEMKRWSAWFPIGEVDNNAIKFGRCYEGIIYVCEEFRTPERMFGARMHYAIQYDIQ